MPPDHASTSTSSEDSGIRVTVVPSQSAFFAGEKFAVKVTFKNTRSTTVTVKRTVSHTHKRTAHSISSVSLARPPTSPITPRSAVGVATPGAGPSKLGKERTGARERRGLIGIRDTIEKDHQFEGHKVLTKSKSVTLTPEDLPIEKPVSPRLRDASLPLSSNHPHARKQSIVDGNIPVQVQLHEMSFPNSPVSQAMSLNGSSSAFSLSLDTISENPSAPVAPSPLAENHSYPPRAPRRTSQVGLGYGPPPIPPSISQPARSSVSATAFVHPNAELILYSYAQLVGSLSLGDPGQSDAERSLNAVRSALLRRQVIGGGSMEISSSLSTESGTRLSTSSSLGSRRIHSRSASLTSSIMSFLSPPPPSSPNSPPGSAWSPSHKARSPSLMSSLLSPSISSPASFPSNVGLGLQSNDAEDVNPEVPLPTFEVQPSMLGVDLVLGPGESRSYTYTLPLPANLPPTFKGKVLRFSYNLVIGICRSVSSPGTPAPHPNNSPSTSRIMRIPIRIYNHVTVSGIQRPYDLLWPVLHPQQKENHSARVTEDRLTSAGPGAKAHSHNSVNGGGNGYRLEIASPLGPVSPGGHPNTLNTEHEQDSLGSLRRYARELLLSSSASPASPEIASLDQIDDSSSPSYRDEDFGGGGRGGGLPDCREAVEILTRNMRKVSYDVNKDGVNVAVLTFSKSAYRLGETVVGVVEVNERSSRARVMKLSAMLEAHESLPSTLTSNSSNASKKLRKLHAEYHSSHMVSTLRTSFTLGIPSDASPAFQCECAAPSPSVVGGTREREGKLGGLEWKVRLCLLVSVASEFSREGFDGLKVKQLVRDGPAGEWGSCWRPTSGIAPSQNIDQRRAAKAAAEIESSTPTQQVSRGGWTSYLSSLLLSGEREYHDGDEDDGEDAYGKEDENNRREESESRLGGGYEEGLVIDENGEVDIGGGEVGWEELRVETVECEVPIRVWPGNTAFRPIEVVFDV